MALAVVNERHKNTDMKHHTAIISHNKPTEQLHEITS